MVGQVRLLGGVSAVTGHGQPADVGPAKCQVLLAALALSAGQAVPAGRLTELIWGSEPPRTAERTLQSYVTRLRQALGPGSIVRAGAAYRLEVPAEAVDVLRFQRRLAAGDAGAALAEWAGPPFAGLEAPGLAAVAAALTEQWLAAVEADLASQVQADGSAGAPGSTLAVVGRLTELTAAYPYRERLWELLMTALYRAGRQGDALTAYRTARQQLIDQLGVEPGPALRELEARILGQDERLLAGRAEYPPPPAEYPPPRAEYQAPWTEDSRRGNLPGRLGRLFGRDELLAAIGDALAAAPAVTLTGPGGIGKTRLAVAAAARRADRDGMWLAELAEITSPDDVPRAVASVLGIRENPGQRLTQSLVTALRSRRALLVLDNCEHVIDAAAGLAQAIVTGCPDVRVLATSREALGLGQGHERLVTVPPLDPAGPGAELFLERALAAGVDLRPERAAVAEICRRLDGVPLAIELAAARTTSLAPAELLARLDDQLRLLTGGPRAGAERHRTLRAAITWSYDLLSPAEQWLWVRLSVFTGPFGAAAAPAVAGPADGREASGPGSGPDRAGPGMDVDELLSGLVTRSMLAAESGPFGRRFRMLETMRQFAAGRLAEAEAGAGADGTGRTAARHARWCLDEVSSIRRLLAGPAEAEGVARLDELWPNLRTAFDWACAGGDRDFAYALVRGVVVEINRRSRNEIGDWVERMLALAPPDEDLVAFGLTWAAERYKLNQDSDAYERLVRRYGEPDHPLVHHARAAVYEDYGGIAKWSAPAVAALRARGEDDLADQLELDVSGGMLMTGQFAESDAFAAALAERFRAQGPPTLLNLTLVMLGYSASLRGEHDRAAALFDDAISVEVPRRTHSPNQAVAARTVFRRGDRTRGLAMLGAYVQQLLDDGNMQAACVSSLEFVNMAVAEGRLREAATMLGYLETTGLLDGPSWRSLVEPAMRVIGTRYDLEQARGGSLEDRAALEYMLGVLRPS